MNERDLDSMASMASEALHRAFIDNGTKDQYLLPEELFDSLLHTLRQLVLHSDDPLKERLLSLYVYCIKESDKVKNENFYGSSEWVNIRTAVKSFLLHIVEFDLEAWEKRELINF
jgi:hypothetical protein